MNPINCASIQLWYMMFSESEWRKGTRVMIYTEDPEVGGRDRVCHPKAFEETDSPNLRRDRDRHPEKQLNLLRSIMETAKTQISSSVITQTPCYAKSRKSPYRVLLESIKFARRCREMDRYVATRYRISDRARIENRERSVKRVRFTGPCRPWASSLPAVPFQQQPCARMREPPSLSARGRAESCFGGRNFHPFGGRSGRTAS